LEAQHEQTKALLQHSEDNAVIVYSRVFAAEARVRELEAVVTTWEAAAKATDIYPYLQDALSRMGTVGPRGIREMVAYCSGLQTRNATLTEALRECASGFTIVWQNGTIGFEALAREFNRRQVIAADAIGQVRAKDALLAKEGERT
jgi:hypothetical protein